MQMYTIFTSCQYFISLYGEVQLPVLYSRQGKGKGDIPDLHIPLKYVLNDFIFYSSCIWRGDTDNQGV